MASTSASDSFEFAPQPVLAPEEVVVPGKIIRKFVPKDLSWLSACSRAPAPIPMVATTHATPMMIPSAVRSERSLFRPSARKATRRMFDVLLIGLPVYGIGGSAGGSHGRERRDDTPLLHRHVAEHLSVAKRHDPSGVLGDVVLVRDEDDRLPFLVQALEYCHDLL